MKIVTGKNKVCKEICEALGLKNARKLDLHMVYDKVVTVTAEFYPEEDGIKKLIPILKRFNLVERGSGVLK